MYGEYGEGTAGLGAQPRAGLRQLMIKEKHDTAYDAQSGRASAYPRHKLNPSAVLCFEMPHSVELQHQPVKIAADAESVSSLPSLHAQIAVALG
ncbi:hypothetical protein F503_03879 [Ophiostoma piceae UAMH 11346]|uniref:Uncharacterized protein n=1 Tax=Ophiostoma piceae (strain UAMH 11346) TaxID=1262450 RepID=S3BVL7_OPHP1|nr:hypothetical protein F503_03879 [Ophiostoma piceae UAMH 11346]